VPLEQRTGHYAQTKAGRACTNPSGLRASTNLVKERSEHHREKRPGSWIRCQTEASMAGVTTPRPVIRGLLLPTRRISTFKVTLPSGRALDRPPRRREAQAGGCPTRPRGGGPRARPRPYRMPALVLPDARPRPMRGGPGNGRRAGVAPIGDHQSCQKRVQCAKTRLGAGDPAGIGPELVAKSWQTPTCRGMPSRSDRPHWLLERGKKLAGVDFPAARCSIAGIEGVPEGTIPVIEEERLDRARVPLRVVSPRLVFSASR